MKQFVIILVTLFTCTAGFAQKESGTTKKLKEIWNSSEDPDTKAKKVAELKLKEADIPVADHYAATLITYQAEQNKDAAMRTLIQRFETMPPGMKKELEGHYPGIISLYEAFALSKSFSLFEFQAELKTSLALKDLDLKNANESVNYIGRMRFYTVTIQRELYDSRNLLVLPIYKNYLSMVITYTKTER